MLACALYILYAGVTAFFNWLLLIAIGSIFIERGALIINRWRCPLTTLARRLGAEKGSVADFFLPTVVARNILKWGMDIFPAELIFLAIRYFIG